MRRVTIAPEATHKPFLRSDPSSASLSQPSRAPDSPLRSLLASSLSSGDKRDCVYSLMKPHQQLPAGFRRTFVVCLFVVFSIIVEFLPISQALPLNPHPCHTGSALPGSSSRRGCLFHSECSSSTLLTGLNQSIGSSWELLRTLGL